MQKLNKLAIKYKYGLILLAALIVKPVVEAIIIDNTFGRWLTIIAESVLVTLICCKFVNHYTPEKQSKAWAFVAVFAAWYFALYNYTLYSVVDEKIHGVCMLLYLTSVLCLLFEHTPALAVALSIAGVIVSGDYAVIFMPSLIVASAFSGGGILASQPAKQSGNKKASKNGFGVLLTKLASPALLIVQLWVVFSYLTADEYQYADRFYAKPYFFELNHLKFIPCIILIVLLAVVWKPLLGNKKQLAAFASGIIAFGVTLFSAYLLDFTSTMFAFYSLSAVIGQFFVIMVLSARADGGGEMDSAVMLCAERRAPVVVFITLLCVAWMAQLTMLI